MRVICIKSDSSTITGPNTVPDGLLKEGSIYTVIDTDVYKNELFYLLSELPVAYYFADLFIPLSSISETEMERSYNFQTETI